MATLIEMLVGKHIVVAGNESGFIPVEILAASTHTGMLDARKIDGGPVKVNYRDHSTIALARTRVFETADDAAGYAAEWTAKHGSKG